MRFDVHETSRTRMKTRINILALIDLFHKDFDKPLQLAGKGPQRRQQEAQATLHICVGASPPCREGMSLPIAVGRSTVLSLGVASEPFTASFQHIVRREVHSKCSTARTRMRGSLLSVPLTLLPTNFSSREKFTGGKEATSELRQGAMSSHTCFFCFTSKKTFTDIVSHVPVSVSTGSLSSVQ